MIQVVDTADIGPFRLVSALLVEEIRAAADPATAAADRTARVAEYVESAAAEIIGLALDLPIDAQVEKLLAIVAGAQAVPRKGKRRVAP